MRFSPGLISLCFVWLMLGACAPSEPGPPIPIIPAGARCALTLWWHGERERVAVRVGASDRVVARVDASPGAPFLVELPPQPAGEVSLRLAGERTGRTQRARWFAFPDRRPVVVCDVDHTIYDGGSLTALRDGDFNAARVMAGAPAALTELAKRYAIVYLSARDERMRERTEHFLREGGFPPGPLLLWSLERDPVSRAALKAKRLRALGAVWPWLAWGIGDRESDQRAYQSASMRAILLEPGAEKARIGRGTWRVGAWGDVPGVIDAPATDEGW